MDQSWDVAIRQITSMKCQCDQSDEITPRQSHLEEIKKLDVIRSL